MSTLPNFPTAGDLDLSTTEPCLPADDNSENILTNWDWTMDFGTSLPPPSPDIQDLSAEVLQLPVEPLDVLTEPFDTPITNEPASLDKDAKSPEEIEDLIDEISDRVGTLRFGPEGQSYFYGPTSTFNLADTPVSHKQAPRTIEDHDANFNTMVPPGLEDHLLKLYFTWQDPSFHVVDREMFENGRSTYSKKEDTPYYSEALCYAM
jgi:hypothetical protein